MLIKKKPPNAERKLLIIGTTSMKDILSELEVLSCFNTVLHVPNVFTAQEVSAILSNFNCSASVVSNIAAEFESFYGRTGVPIKTLLLAVELAIERDGQGCLTQEHFIECLASVKGN